MSFKEILDAIGAEEKATALSDELFQKAEKEYGEILARRAAGRPRIADLVRRHGPTVAKLLGGSGIGTVLTALAADEGGYSGVTGFFSLVGQLFAW